MPSEHENLLVLLKNIQESLKSYTVEELNDAIQKVLSQKQDKHAEKEFVLNAVTTHYSISRRTLIKSNARGPIQEAKKLTYCLLHYNLGFTIRHIAIGIFGYEKCHSNVGRAIKYFTTLNDKVKVDREFKEKYEAIQRQLMEFLKSKEAA